MCEYDAFKKVISAIRIKQIISLVRERKNVVELYGYHFCRFSVIGGIYFCLTFEFSYYTLSQRKCIIKVF